MNSEAIDEKHALPIQLIQLYITCSKI